MIDVLLPTSGRVAELAVVLAGLAAQDDPPFRVILSDQSDDHAMAETPAVQAMLRVLRAQGREVRVLRHLPRRGIAEHRAFLLEQASAPYVLFLDDDVWPEPGLLATLHRAIEELGCGLVGSAQQGLSYLEDVRPHEQAPFTAWSGACGRSGCARTPPARSAGRCTTPRT
ncbi:glycosyltransferase family 2 protein [Amnibacterium kyonggiense]